jgi:Ca2+:H+ antiporter
MILTAVTVSMIIPEFIPQSRWRAYSCFTIAAMLLLYGVFLRMQTGPHSYFFSYSYPDKKTRRPLPTSGYPTRGQSAAVMAIGIIAVGALAELMSHSLDRSLEGIEVPPGLVALIVAGFVVHGDTDRAGDGGPGLDHRSAHRHGHDAGADIDDARHPAGGGNQPQ